MHIFIYIFLLSINIFFHSSILLCVEKLKITYMKVLKINKNVLSESSLYKKGTPSPRSLIRKSASTYGIHMVLMILRYTYVINY